MQRLDAASLTQELIALPKWKFCPERGGHICRSFEFADFAEAFGFMARMAMDAERRGHHPEWCNVYNRVDITLTTHDVGGLSMNDIVSAKLADQLHACAPRVVA